MNNPLARLVTVVGFAILSPVLATAQSQICAGYEAASLTPQVQLPSASMDGDVLIMGYPAFGAAGSEEGAAYVYRRQGSAWSVEQLLHPSGAAFDEQTGYAVSVSGDVAVVGANSQNCTGAATVFRFNGNTWVEEQVLTPSATSWCSRFGSAVAVSGDLILVGAEEDAHPQLGGQAGAVFAYHFNGSQWIEEAILQPSDLYQDARFGYSIDLEGDLALIGSPGRYLFSGFPPGAAYTFRRTGPGLWTEEQKLTASDAHSGDMFGESIALDGNRLAVGAPRHQIAGAVRGAAYVFRRNTGPWIEEQALVAQVEGTPLSLGQSIALNGTMLAVGAPDQDAPWNYSGAVHVFQRNGSTWRKRLELRASDVDYSWHFGASVAMNQDCIATGSNGGFGSGGAYFFERQGFPRCPSTYCSGKLNSAGCIPTIGYVGSASVTAAGPCMILATNIINKKVGFLTHGFASSSAPFMGGTLCVAAPQIRSAPLFSWGLANGDNCTGNFVYNFNNSIQSGGAGLNVGATVYVQYIYRDPLDPFMMGMTDAVRLVINP